MGFTSARTGSHTSVSTTSAFTCGAFPTYIVEHKNGPHMGFTIARTGTHTNGHTTSALTCGVFSAYTSTHDMLTPALTPASMPHDHTNANTCEYNHNSRTITNTTETPGRVHFILSYLSHLSSVVGSLGGCRRPPTQTWSPPCPSLSATLPWDLTDGSAFT